MLGVIAGDVIGSRFEWEPIKTTDFALFHGARFRGWLFEERPRPYNSFGNRSAMRVAFAERPGSARGQTGVRPGSDGGQPRG
jgi:hypothetical protein